MMSVVSDFLDLIERKYTRAWVPWAGRLLDSEKIQRKVQKTRIQCVNVKSF
jgi:hypothetical protein